jgi:hypothetical protein
LFAFLTGFAFAILGFKFTLYHSYYFQNLKTNNLNWNELININKTLNSPSGVHNINMSGTGNTNNDGNTITENNNVISNNINAAQKPSFDYNHEKTLNGKIVKNVDGKIKAQNNNAVSMDLALKTNEKEAAKKDLRKRFACMYHLLN